MTQLHTPPTAGEPIWLTEDRPDEHDLGLCVHCGFCLNACPTYLDLGIETDSPRGRIALMRALDTGRVDWTPRVQQHFDQCLQCRACETACPSKVPYGRLMEATRAEAFAQQRWPRRRRIVWNIVMRGVFPSPRRMRLAGYGLKLFQRSGMQALVRRSGLLRRLSPALADIEALSPDARDRFYNNAEAARERPAEPVRLNADLLTGCMMPLAYPETHRATVRVFARNGVAVSAPNEQVCCGALHAHGGDVEMARQLARKNIDAFLPDGAVAARRDPDQRGRLRLASEGIRPPDAQRRRLRGAGRRFRRARARRARIPRRDWLHTHPRAR